MKHILNIDKEHYTAIKKSIKTWLFRYHNHNFKVGDTIMFNIVEDIMLLRPAKREYRVIYVELLEELGWEQGWCGMSIKKMAKRKKRNRRK